MDCEIEKDEFLLLHLQLLAEALVIPDQFILSTKRNVCDAMEGLCMVLRRMAYPCRCSDLISRFGRPVPVLTMICNQVIDFIYDSHGHHITECNPVLLDPPSLQKYDKAIAMKGSPLDNCFGFIEGTV